MLLLFPPGLVWVNLKLTQLQPWSGRDCLVCLGSCSGMSNFGRCLVVGPNSVVQEPQELSAKAGVLGPAKARPILIGAWSWDLTPWSGNHRSCLQRQMYQSSDKNLHIEF
ncbi:hypothetical protein TIFTF001_038870 [Ficus carica]|uniref:Uncharacterized protein n=1 Tax=Ficus carica TaxID=3494 RepID=A0AA88E9Q3_FICCA|nr:hypothetical protein TIFTF001_038870 [Ficus carica]